MPANLHERRRRFHTGGPWGTGLLLYGVGFAMYGIGHMIQDTEELSAALQSFGHTIPIAWWSILWVMAGCYSVVRALRPPQRAWDVWPLVVMTVLWSAVYFVHWITRALAGDWLDASGTIALVWASTSAVLVCWGRCVNPPNRR